MSYRGGNNNFGGAPMGTPQYNSYPNQGPSKFGGNSKSALTQIKDNFEKLNDKVENLTDHPLMKKVQPYIPSIARFFIVATFYEDSIRILTQWSDQVFYLYEWKRYPYYFVIFFLFSVSIVMFVSATLLILRKQTIYATGALCSCIILQGLIYGLFAGSSFVLRNFSVIGGLLIAFSDSIVQNKTTFGMLPELHDKSRQFKGYLLLAGRILIVLMFIGFTFSKSWFTVIITLIGTVCFAVGYKTKLASLMLGLILTFYNITVNNYWLHNQTKRDFLKYEFYQNLSIIGALLLITNTGAGEMSIDNKKKVY
ncbi:ER-derived vesicles protein Erv29p [Monosporozyma unispora]|nr:ER-derived vesicles protein erv29 [Kazachstania unispora]